MQGSSRAAAAAGMAALESALQGGADGAALADDLFALAAAVDGNATLRRALTDPSRQGEGKRGLAGSIFGGRVSKDAASIVGDLAAQRWAGERDLTDTLETLGVQAVLDAAERHGRLEDVEDELFRFERTVAGNPRLRDAVTNRQADPGARADLVSSLLQGKASPETVRLARQAVLAPRGRRFDRTVEEYLQLAAERRERLTATVTSAVPLEESQRSRLAAALQQIYGKPIQLQMIIDPDVVGGLVVRVGDEVIDGTIASKIDLARRHLA